MAIINGQIISIAPEAENIPITSNPTDDMEMWIDPTIDNADGIDFAEADHNHDGVYAPVSHDHNDVYYIKAEVDTKISDAKTAVKNDLLNGAGAAYDTLKELGDLIDDNTDAIDALETVAASKANASDVVPKSGTTMTGALIAAGGAVGTAQVRNIYFGTTELTAGSASSQPEGTMYFTYK